MNYSNYRYYHCYCYYCCYYYCYCCRCWWCGGGDFFFAFEDFKVDGSFPTCAIFQVETSSRTLIPLFRPESVHCGSAS